MTVTRQRRLRGTGKFTVAFNAHIDQSTKSKIDIVADALGKSQGQVLDLLLQQIEVARDGRPAFWDGPLASELNEELPLATPA